MTAKKKRDARATLLPQTNGFLPFLLPSPSSLLKLPTVVIYKFFYHDDITLHVSSLLVVAYRGKSAKGKKGEGEPAIRASVPAFRPLIR